MKTKSKKLDKEEIISFLRLHKSDLEGQFGVVKIALFGSYARGEETESSDIDVLIESRDHDFRKRLRLRDFLEQNLGKKVDVGYIESVRPHVMYFVQKELIYA